jgi:hypothetical protein
MTPGIDLNCETSANTSMQIKNSLFSKQGYHETVGVTGFSCRFPDGIGSVDEFWISLCEKRDAIKEIPVSR